VGEPHRIFPAPGFAGHNDDILCIAHCEPRLLATGSYDGEIVVWSLASGSGRFFLRLSDYGDYDDPELNNAQHGQRTDRRPTMTVAQCASRSNRPTSVMLDADFAKSIVDEIDGEHAEPHPPATSRRDRKGSTFGSEHRQIIEKEHLKHTMDTAGLVTQKAKSHYTADHPNLAKKIHHHKGGSSSLEDDEEKKADDVDNAKDVPSDEKGKLAVECLLFLKTKRIGEVLGQTLVSAGADSKVRFWSVKDGSLCHVLKTCHPNEASITCMASDDANKYLFTGCAGGYIKVWTLKTLEKAASHRLHRRFSVLGDEKELEEDVGMHRRWADSSVANSKAHRKNQGGDGNAPAFTFASPRGKRGSVSDHASAAAAATAAAAAGGGASEPSTGKKKKTTPRGRRGRLVESDYTLPKVYEVSGWKAHTGTLVSIEFVGSWGGKELILTASTDCNVSIWTVMGSHLGIFGQGSSWSLVNPNHWLEKKEHGVEKPKGTHMRGGGLLNDGDTSEGGRGRTGGKGKDKERDFALEEDSDSDDEELLDENGNIIDKEKLKNRKKYQKLLAKFEQIVSMSEGKLEPYHYLLAKAKLDKKVMISECARKGGKGADSPIVKEALWNQRWGTGLRPSIPDEDEVRRTQKGGVHIGPGGFHEVLIRNASATTGEGMGIGTGLSKKGGLGKKQRSQTTDAVEKQNKSKLKMKELRSNCNSVAHQLGLHAIDTVETCRGAELVKRTKGQEKRSMGIYRLKVDVGAGKSGGAPSEGKGEEEEK
jgi:WD40 repeat protein